LGINYKLFSKPVLSSRGTRRLPGSDLLARDRSTMAHDPMKHQPNWLPPASEALAVSIALDRMNSDSETPRDRAVSASMSRSRGRRRTATKAVRCLDSERLRGVTCSRFPALLTAIFLPPAGPLSSLGASDHGISTCGITAPACRGGYTASGCDDQAEAVRWIGGCCALADQARCCIPLCAADCQTCTSNYDPTADWLRRTDGPVVALDSGWAVDGSAMSGGSRTFCRPRTAGCSGG
jgi:hypothetical protein